MKNKLKYPIKLDNGKIIRTIQDEKEFFYRREKQIKENLFKKNSNRNSITSGTSSEYCYGIDII